MSDGNVSQIMMLNVHIEPKDSLKVAMFIDVLVKDYPENFSEKQAGLLKTAANILAGVYKKSN